MPVPGNGKTRVVFFLLVLVSFFAGIREVAAQTIKLPVTIDYGLLQTLIIRNAYTEANQTVTLLNTGNGCVSLVLSKPSVSEANGLIRFETNVSVHAGTPVGDKCLVPVSWQGYLVLFQRPVIDGKTWKLSFTTTSSTLLDMNKRPAKIAGVAWNLIKSKVFSYLESITIDLAPPVNDLKTFLLPLFPTSMQQQTQTMLKTLRKGETRVTPKAVVVELLADVQEVYKKEDVQQKEVLSGKALDDMVGIWEQWDAMLSFMVSLMSRNVLTEAERQTLMDVLLETRYAFVEGLSSQNLSHDFVREQFVRAWRRLSPIFRNHLGQNSDEHTLGYLSFFTAADALSVLDGLGPTFGIEMSRDGLIRMARMLTSDQSILNYGSGVSLDLRKLFQLMPALQIEKEETPEDAGGKPTVLEDRKIEERPIGGEGIDDQGGLIDKTKQSVPEGKNGTGIVPSDKTIKTTPPDQGNKAVPDKPVERDIETGDPNKLQEMKTSGQADGKNTENRPAAPEEKGKLGRLIEQIRKGSSDDGKKNSTQAAPPDKTIKTTPPDQGNKAVPDKPVERDIETGDLNKLQEMKTSGQADGKNTETRPAGPKEKAELGRLIEQLKQEAPQDGGKNGTQAAPPDQTMKSTPPDQGHKAVPDKPVERDIETRDLNKQQEMKPSGQADGGNTETGPAGPKEKAELGRLIEQLKQEVPQDGGKSGSQVVPPDQTIKNTPPDQGHKAVPDKPVEKDIDIDNAFKLQNKEKPSGQVDEKKENKISPEGKGEQSGSIEQKKQAPDHDQTMKGNKPQAIPDKPVEQDIKSDDPFNLHDKEKPLEKGDTPQPVDPKDKQTRALQVPLGAMIWDFLFPPAYAGDLAKHDILNWKVPENGVDQYVKRVVEVLDKTSQVLMSRVEFPASMKGSYRSMIIAMAWQESCFRQFIEKDHQLTYLLSYNNTSVGLMQVNERVWRGLYDREKLRWDIEYNAAAGNEISFLYLQKYALRDKNAAKKLDPATLARLVYAMYNGGPGQYHDFLERLRKGKMLSYDDHFWEKYSSVTSGKWEKLSQCLKN